MAKAIKCTIHGIEMHKDGVVFYYVGITKEGIGLVGISIGKKNDGEVSQSIVFDSIKEANTILQLIKTDIKINNPNRRIHWSITRLGIKYQFKNTRIKLKNKTFLTTI